jgi:nitroimidazol reductase NimA-like FMN-containing flavoprotein (pyridoxamine 5'-phosphate oxidase superfamily)
MSLLDCPITGTWGRDEVTLYLDDTVIPIRLAVTSPTGWPIVLSLWFVREEGQLLCATQQSASVVRALRENERCAFEIARDAPPYHGVRGRGRVTLDTQSAPRVLETLVDRYLPSRDEPLARWLLSRVASEVCIRIDPLRIASWDYRKRM